MRSLDVGGPCRRERIRTGSGLLDFTSGKWISRPGRPARRDAVNRVRSEACFTASRGTDRGREPPWKRDAEERIRGGIMTSVCEIQIESLQPRNIRRGDTFLDLSISKNFVTLTFEPNDGVIGIFCESTARIYETIKHCHKRGYKILSSYLCSKPINSTNRRYRFGSQRNIFPAVAIIFQRSVFNRSLNESVIKRIKVDLSRPMDSLSNIWINDNVLLFNRGLMKLRS